MSVGELRLLICEKLKPPKQLSEVEMITQGRIIRSPEDIRTLEEAKFNDRQQIICSKTSEIVEEVVDPLNTQTLEMLKAIFEDMDDKILQKALKKANSIDEACELLSIESSLEEIKKEV